MNFENIVLTDVSEAMLVYVPQKRYTEIKNRSYYGFSVCMDGGQITYTQNGVTYIENNTHAVILPQGQSYALRGNVSGNYPVINFCTMTPLTDTIVEIPLRDSEFVIRRCSEIRHLCATGGNRNKIFMLMYEIFSELNTEKEYNIISPAVRFIHENYFAKQITNADLAGKCNISEVYFRKLFTAQLGVSPKKYISSLRIRRAKQLLSEGNSTIAWIAENCGFDSTTHFYRAFKAKVGAKPGEYRKKNQIGKI